MSDILVVEDEPKISSVMREYLLKAGHDVTVLENGHDVVPRMRSAPPDLIILDIMLPGLDGLDVCKTVRAFSDVPIIMVTARVEEIDRLLGLELGADDYICKPFSPRELVARVKANLRRMSGSAGRITDSPTKPLQVSNEHFNAVLDGQLLELTPVEFRLLRALSDSPGRVWPRDELLDHMYADYRVVSDRTVDSHITNLRRKLKAVRPDQEIVRSVYGVGYKLDI